MTISISVRNYAGCSRADIEVAGVTVLAGLNGAGKSSIAEAAQAALTGQPVVLAGLKKKDAAELVTIGAKKGSAEIGSPGGKVSVEWPKCEVSVTGDAPPKASEIAAGLTSLLDMPTKERAPVLVKYLRCEPAFDDLADAMRDAGYEQAAIDAAWKSVEADGWDAAHKSAMERGTKLKGAWEHATGERFGAAKINGWEPEGWDGGLADIAAEAIEAGIVDLRASREAALRKAGADQAAVEALKETAGRKLPNLAGLREIVVEAEKALADAEAARAKLPPVPGKEDGHSCPACGAVLSVRPRHTGGYDLAELVEEKIAPTEIDKRRMAIAAADGGREKAVAELAAARRAITEGEREVKAIEDAKAKLAALPESDAGSAGEAERLLGEIAREEGRLAAKMAKDEADRIAGQWQRLQALIAALAPDGLRKAALARGLDTINGRLKKVCEKAAWPLVRIDEALEIHVGGHRRAAESWRWMARVALQLVMAHMDKSDLVVIDRADVLDSDHMAGLFDVLALMRRPVLVCMTMSEMMGCPGADRLYWLDRGTVAEPKMREVA